MTVAPASNCECLGASALNSNALLNPRINYSNIAKGLKYIRDMGETNFCPNRAPIRSFGTPFCAESVSLRRGVHFSGLDAKLRRDDASGRNYDPSGRKAQLLPADLRHFVP